MRKTWRDLEKDHDAHVAESAAKSSDLEKKIGELDSDVTAELKKLNEMVEPIADFFRSTKLINVGFKWVLGVIVAVVAIAGGIKTVFFK